MPNIVLPSIEIQFSNNDDSSKASIQAVSNLKLCCTFSKFDQITYFLSYVAMSNDPGVQSTDFSVAHTLRISTFLIIEPQPCISSSGGILRQIL